MSFWCPACKKKGLNPYDKKGIRPEKTDDVHHLWCLYCDYVITSDTKAKQTVLCVEGEK